jgi:hypothetical protein
MALRVPFDFMRIRFSGALFFEVYIKIPALNNCCVCVIFPVNLPFIFSKMQIYLKKIPIIFSLCYNRVNAYLRGMHSLKHII